MYASVAQRLKALEGREIAVRLEKKLSLPRAKDGLEFNLQGGGSDGTYGYFVMVTRGPSETAMSYIHKVELSTWEVVKVSKPLPLHHANDVCYDPRHHRLVVSHCDIHPDWVSFIDPDTLELVETVTIPQRHFSMGFCPEKGLYVAGKSLTYDFVVMDEAFRPLKLLEGVPGYVKQGMECDEEFIYFLHYDPKVLNWIYLFNWEGQLQRRIPVPMVGECEHLFVMGDTLVCGFNSNETASRDMYILHLEEK